jgi:hypothetical protein
MKTILVWYMISQVGASPYTFSPPVATLEDCKRMQSADKYLHSKCIQVNLVVN